MGTPSVDSSYLFTDGGLQCNSFDLPISDGEFKTKNKTPDEVQRKVITDRGAASYFKSNVRIISCIHGRIQKDKPNTRFATVLVLEYRLHPKPGHNFNSVHTRFQFTDVSTTQGENLANPRILAFAPFKRPRLFQESEGTINADNEVSGSIGTGDSAPVNASIGVKFSQGETHIQKYFARASADIHENESTGLDDTVWWQLEQNKGQKLGVLPVFRVAVLIERDSLADFVGIFKMDIDGSFTYNLEQTRSSLVRFFRRMPVDDPVNFSPAKKPSQGKTDGIDSEALGLLLRDIGHGDGLYLPDDYHLESFLPE